MRIAGLVVVLLLAGCTDAPGSEVADGPAPPPAVATDPWGGDDRILVAQRDVPLGAIREFDALCTFGGTAFYELPGDERAPNTTIAFEFTVASGRGTTGVQAGYSTGGDITWLDVVVLDEKTFGVEVADAPEDWLFHYQLNVAAQQDCYTGASVGDYRIDVHALKS